MSNQRLQLTLSAKGLPNLAGMLWKSNPVAVVAVRGNSKDNPPEIIGITDVVYNSLNPTWATVVSLDGYNFGVHFFFEVGVYDFNPKFFYKHQKDLAQHSSDAGRWLTAAESILESIRSGKSPHKIMGTALFEVDTVLGSRGSVASKSLQSGGVLYVHLERNRPNGAFGRMQLQLQGRDLISKNKRFGRKCSPFFELYRRVDSRDGDYWIKVFHSSVVKSNANPIWETSRLQLEEVCNGDMHRLMKVVVKDFSNAKEIIGEFETTMQRFLDIFNEGAVSCKQPSFLLRRGHENVGHVTVLKAEALLVSQSNPVPQASACVPAQVPRRLTTARPEFVDYLAGGLKISLAIGIDLSASNGGPSQEGTAHFLYPVSASQKNDYEKAIIAVGRILEKFDSDGMIPTWGFGAKYGSTVGNSFQIGNDKEVCGVQGVLDAYRAVFNTQLTMMSTPTAITTVIGTAMSYAENETKAAKKNGDLSYTILLILTAGNLENFEETRKVLAEASDYPLSVVIVGIGNHNFSTVRSLDEHDTAYGGRDITKFVEFNKYRSYAALSKEVLCEIPDQVVDYFSRRGVAPKKPVVINRENVRVMPPDEDKRTETFWDDTMSRRESYSFE